MFLTVRYGSKSLEFEKGKAAIVLKDKTRLTATIDTLISAISAGELDDQLAQNAKTSAIAKPRTLAS